MRVRRRREQALLSRRRLKWWPVAWALHPPRLSVRLKANIRARYYRTLTSPELPSARDREQLRSWSVATAGPLATVGAEAPQRLGELSARRRGIVDHDHIRLRERGRSVLEALVGADQAALVLGEEHRAVKPHQVGREVLVLGEDVPALHRDEAARDPLDHPLCPLLVDAALGHLRDRIPNERRRVAANELRHRVEDLRPHGGELPGARERELRVAERQAGHRLGAPGGDPNRAADPPAVGDDEEPVPSPGRDLLQAALGGHLARQLTEARHAVGKRLVTDPRQVVGDHLSPFGEQRLDRPLQLGELGDEEQPRLGLRVQGHRSDCARFRPLDLAAATVYLACAQNLPPPTFTCTCGLAPIFTQATASLALRSLTSV